MPPTSLTLLNSKTLAKIGIECHNYEDSECVNTKTKWRSVRAVRVRETKLGLGRERAGPAAKSPDRASRPLTLPLFSPQTLRCSRTGRTEQMQSIEIELLRVSYGGIDCDCLNSSTTAVGLAV